MDKDVCELVEALDTVGFHRELCRNACAEFGDPPCYEIDPDWLTFSPGDVRACDCRDIVMMALKHIKVAPKPDAKEPS